MSYPAMEIQERFRAATEQTWQGQNSGLKCKPCPHFKPYSNFCNYNGFPKPFPMMPGCATWEMVRNARQGELAND